MATLSIVLATLLASVSASPVILESVAELPEGWTKAASVLTADKDISFSIALRQPKLDNLPALLAQGGKHLTHDEAQALRAPNQADVDDVLSWLNSAGIKDATAKNDWIHVKTTIEEAEKLLNAELHTYSFKDQTSRVRTREYTVPEHLSSAIDFIHPISNFMDPVRTRKAPVTTPPARFQVQGTAACSSGVTPKCLRQLYNINYQPPNNKSVARLGISGYLEENPSHNDTQTFFKKYAPELVGYDFKVETVNGGQDPETDAGGEAQLDLEYAMAIGYPAATTYYATGGRGVKLGDDGKPVSDPDNEPYLDFINTLLDKPDDQIPHVLSVSYGDDEFTVPKAYAEKVCQAYGLLSKRGTTVVHSSGDGGSTGGQRGNCRSKDGKNTKTTMATFPAGCPWVTSIGGTSNTQEPPPGIGFSSGGFSAYFPRESWQDSVVTTYQTSLNGKLDGYYNKSGRGIPDISAVATSFAVVVNGFTQSIGGTSASAPLIAGLLSLVNDARLRAGKQSLGFVNELLYSDKVRAVLQDITTGSSYACDFASTGWPAAKGWDAITGLGVPKDFQKFFDVLVAS